VRLDRKATSISLRVVLGVRADGQKVLLAIKSMGGESAETPETRLAKPSFGMSVSAVISKSVVSFRSMLVRLSGADGDKGFDDVVWTNHGLSWQAILRKSGGRIR
jgi:hypothetical protein